MLTPLSFNFFAVASALFCAAVLQVVPCEISSEFPVGSPSVNKITYLGSVSPFSVASVNLSYALLRPKSGSVPPSAFNPFTFSINVPLLFSSSNKSVVVPCSFQLNVAIPILLFDDLSAVEFINCLTDSFNASSLVIFVVKISQFSYRLSDISRLFKPTEI